MDLHLHWYRRTDGRKDFAYTYHYEARCRCGVVRWFDRWDEDR